MSNAYINVKKVKSGFVFDASGKDIPVTEENIQKLLDFTISKLPVKDRTPLATNLIAEGTFVLEALPEWVDAVTTQLEGYKAEKANKLSWSFRRDDGAPLTSENLQAIDAILHQFSLEPVAELVEYKKEVVNIGGHNFDVSLPLTVVYRKKQDRKEKAE